MSASAPTPRCPLEVSPSSRAGPARVMMAISYSEYSRVLALPEAAVVEGLLVHLRHLLLAELAVHEEADELGIAHERPAVGMVGREHHAPGVLRPQEQLEPDRPLQGIGVDLVLVGERQDPAAALVLDVGVGPLGAAEAPQHVSQRGVRGHAGGAAEHHGADVRADVGVRVDELRDFRGLGGRIVGGLPGHRAVAVKLDVGDVRPAAAGDAHGLERGRVVARVAQVVAVDVHRVGQPQVVAGLDEGADHLPRGEVEGADLLVQRRDVGVALALPHLVHAGVDQLGGVGLGGADPPGQRLAELLDSPLLEQAEQQHVVADQDEESLVDDRRVLELLQRAARAEWASPRPPWPRCSRGPHSGSRW